MKKYCWFALFISFISIGFISSSSIFVQTVSAMEKTYAQEEALIELKEFHVGEQEITGVANNEIVKCKLILNDELVSQAMVNEQGFFRLDAGSLYGKITAASILKVVGYDNQENEIVEQQVNFIMDEKREQILEPSSHENYKSICAIQVFSNSGKAGVGTGFVIGKDLILTNKHVLPPGTFEYARVYPGATQENFDATDAEKYFTVEESIACDGGEDLVVAKVGKNIFTKQSIGTYAKPLSLVKNFETIIGTNVSVVGYPGDKPWPTMWKSDGKIITNKENTPIIGNNSIITDAWVYGGNSGSPIFNEKNQVVGIINLIVDVTVGNKVRNARGIRFTNEIYDFIQNCITRYESNEEVEIPDLTLKSIFRERLGLSENEAITVSKLWTISGELDLSEKGITNLEGIQYTNIKSLNLSKNPNIADFSVLKKLNKLDKLDVSYCDISDARVFSDFGRRIPKFVLDGNHIKDLSPLNGILGDYSAKNQTIEEQVQKIKEGSDLTFSLDGLKETDGQLPGTTSDHYPIHPQNGGKFNLESMQIVWDKENLKNVGSVSYKFGEDRLFSGVVTIPFVIESSAQPAEWGLSVPAAIKLDKNTKVGGNTIHYGNAKVAIIDAQGQDLVDTSKDRTFSISGQGTGTDGHLAFEEQDGTKHNNFLYAGLAGNQGAAEPTEMTQAAWNAAQNTSIASDLETKADGANAKAERWVQFGVNEAKTGFDKAGNYHETVSWTATEKNA